MQDGEKTIQDLKGLVAAFCDEREWQQFHSPKNLSAKVVLEAAELMEFFCFVNEADSLKVLEQRRSEVEDEIADVAFVLLDFCRHNNIDLASALEKKIAKTALKYPIEKCRGKYFKYDQLDGND